MSFDISGAINSATTAVNAAKSAVSFISKGPVAALGALGLGSIGDSITGLLGSLTAPFKTTGLKLPLKNPLFNYASYDYVLGIGCLTDYELNHPDTTYQAGKKFPLIAKNANIDPSNRVETIYGKFDFYIDNLEMKSLIGFLPGLGNTNVTNMSFTITEPYSMGMFIFACQTIAQKLGHDNWREAPFILTIDFRGNKENGQMDIIKGCSRRIPFAFTNLSMKVTEAGSVYTCEAMPYNQAATLDVNALFKKDVATSGTTVQEILQTGSNSLQAALNRRSQELVTQGTIKIPDEYLILFPVDPSSQATPASGSTNNEEESSATISSSVSADKLNDLFGSLGVSRSTLNQTLIQQSDACNALGRASLGFDEDRRGDPTTGKDNVLYDKTGRFNRNKAGIDIKESEMRFTQDTSIPAAINQILLLSDFAKEALDPANLSDEGYRGWWRIDCQVYNISSSENMESTGTKPKLIVYRVVPYSVHASRMTPPNVKAPGYDNLKKQAVKEYNYIFTGKNVDVLRFDITINNGFSVIMGADSLQRTADKVQGGATASVDEPDSNVSPLPDGNKPSKQPGAMPTIVKYTGTTTSSDKVGGGGQESQGQRAAKLFQDALTTSTDLYDLNLEIIGDPYFIQQSGTGNFTAQETEYKNLNSDGSMNHQNGEVDIMISFRSPIDINQTTGLYAMGAGSKSAPVLAYSGLYCVNSVASKFSGGTFKQVLTGFRRPQQEKLFDDPPDKLFNTKRTEEPPNDSDPGYDS